MDLERATFIIPRFDSDSFEASVSRHTTYVATKDHGLICPDTPVSCTNKALGFCFRERGGG